MYSPKKWHVVGTSCITSKLSLWWQTPCFGKNVHSLTMANHIVVKIIDWLGMNWIEMYAWILTKMKSYTYIQTHCSIDGFWERESARALYRLAWMRDVSLLWSKHQNVNLEGGFVVHGLGIRIYTSYYKSAFSFGCIYILLFIKHVNLGDV